MKHMLLKLSLFAFAATFLVFGLIYIALGLALVDNPDSKDVDTNLENTGAFIVVFGIGCIIVSFFGTCGVLFRKRWSLIVFTVLVILKMISCFSMGVNTALYDIKSKYNDTSKCDRGDTNKLLTSLKNSVASTFIIFMLMMVAGTVMSIIYIVYLKKNPNQSQIFGHS